MPAPVRATSSEAGLRTATPVGRGIEADGRGECLEGADPLVESEAAGVVPVLSHVPPGVARMRDGGGELRGQPRDVVEGEQAHREAVVVVIGVARCLRCAVRVVVDAGGGLGLGAVVEEQLDPVREQGVGGWEGAATGGELVGEQDVAHPQRPRRIVVVPGLDLLRQQDAASIVDPAELLRPHAETHPVERARGEELVDHVLRAVEVLGVTGRNVRGDQEQRGVRVVADEHLEARQGIRRGVASARHPVVHGAVGDPADVGLMEVLHREVFSSDVVAPCRK